MIVWARGVAGDSFWAMVDLAGCALDLLPTGRTDEIGWQGSAEFVNRAVSGHVVNTNRNSSEVFVYSAVWLFMFVRPRVRRFVVSA